MDWVLNSLLHVAEYFWKEVWKIWLVSQNKFSIKKFFLLGLEEICQIILIRILQFFCSKVREKKCFVEIFLDSTMI